jgi:hypothetical protein
MNHAVLCACEDCLYEIGQSDCAAAEVAAEGAWLRVAEAGTPDTWADRDRELMHA